MFSQIHPPKHTEATEAFFFQKRKTTSFVGSITEQYHLSSNDFAVIQDDKVLDYWDLGSRI